MQEELDILCDNDPSKQLNPHTIIGRKRRTMSKTSTAITFIAGIATTVAFNTFVAGPPDWAAYLPEGEMLMAKAVMRVCQDPTICPNGPDDASSVTVSYPARVPMPNIKRMSNQTPLEETIAPGKKLIKDLMGKK